MFLSDSEDLRWCLWTDFWLLWIKRKTSSSKHYSRSFISHIFHHNKFTRIIKLRNVSQLSSQHSAHETFIKTLFVSTFHTRIARISPSKHNFPSRLISKSFNHFPTFKISFSRSFPSSASIFAFSLFEPNSSLIRFNLIPLPTARTHHWLDSIKFYFPARTFQLHYRVYLYNR